ncbi:dephospho-CoA kinase [Fulvivirga lutea]|uniref:Dephospho-CoA kinase n=1 Tax=Fulvivirga lutea TaxID=2810512 RepID=A0A974WMD2_9BACT|nr:dephospho-CoA kinase [Fulvivirga lutea]QSE98088.1 dephospho-CoA kinase [Fulvivirga lutea]
MKDNLLKVGITGGIGSGKSLICKIFSKLGIPIYDADSRAKWLNNNDPLIREKIIENFGEESYHKGELNRDYISKIVFNDTAKLELLNSIIHPAVGRDFKNWCEQQNSPYIIKEAALMFESGSYKALDKVITVSASRELRIERVLKRDPFRDKAQIESIINKQLSEEERLKRSDYVIKNDEHELVIPQVLKLHKELLDLTNH